MFGLKILYLYTVCIHLARLCYFRVIRRKPPRGRGPYPDKHKGEAHVTDALNNWSSGIFLIMISCGALSIRLIPWTSAPTRLQATPPKVKKALHEAHI